MPACALVSWASAWSRNAWANALLNVEDSFLYRDGKEVRMAKPAAKSTRAEEHNVLAALSYLVWPLALVLIVIEETKESKKDRHLRHHAYNALGFAFAWFVVYLLIEVLTRLLIDPFDLTRVLFTAAVIAIAIVFALRAYRREEVVVPFITPFLKRTVKEF
jgi:uncharacterized membrane protein